MPQLEDRETQKEKRVQTADLMYKLRKHADRDVNSEIKTKCIELAELIEASYLTILGPQFEEHKGEQFCNYDIMTVAEFAQQIKAGAYNDYDGTGYYGSETEVSRLLSLPSDFAKGKISKRFTHVIWYNK